MEKSDPKVLNALRAMYAVIGMSYYLDTILVVGVGSPKKDWVSDSDNIAEWLLEKIAQHPARESVYVDEEAMDSHLFEWADRITNLAKIYTSSNEEIGEEDALYYIYCQWLARVVSLFVQWAQDKVESSIFNTNELVQWAKLKTRLLQEIPLDKQQWENFESRMDEFAKSWANKTLS